MTHFYNRLPAARTVATFFATVFLLVAHHAIGHDLPKQSPDWTNPATGKATHFAEPWSSQDMPSPDGRGFIMMSEKARLVVVFAYEQMEEAQTDAVAYGKAFAQVKAQEMTIAPDWQAFEVGGFKAARSTLASAKKANIRGEIVVAITGRTVWRLIVLGVDETPKELYAGREPFMQALLSTIGEVREPDPKP